MKAGADIIRWSCPKCQSELREVEWRNPQLIVICSKCHYEQVVMEITKELVKNLIELMR